MALDTIVTGSKLEDIADAIRAKTGASGALTLDDMPDEIDSISGGGCSLDFSQTAGLRFKFKDSETSIVMDGSDVSPFTTMANMFSGNYNMRRFQWRNLDARSITSFANLFYSCTTLQRVDMRYIQTSAALVDMSYMFYSCGQLLGTNFYGIDTSHVVNMSYMFYSAHIPSLFDFSWLDTSAVTNFANMFQYSQNMQHLDLYYFDTSSATNMQAMFNSCSNLKTINLASFETTNLVTATSMNYMFSGCSNLTSIIWSQKPTLQLLPAPPSNIGISSSVQVFVPDALYNDYLNDPYFGSLNLCEIAELGDDIAEIYDGHY